MALGWLALFAWTATTICLSAHAQKGCPPGTVPVGEREERPEPNVIVVHPVCQQLPVQKTGVSPQSVTKHLEYKGEFHVLTKNGKKLRGDANTPVVVGSTIVTGRNSQVKITLLDDTTFTIGPGSEMVMDEFVYDPDTSLKKITARVLKGAFRWVSGHIGRQNEGSDATLKLPSDALGIRGTDFEVEVNPDGSGYIKLYEGQLAITETKTGKVFLMNARQMVTLDADGTIGNPGPLNR